MEPVPAPAAHEALRAWGPLEVEVVEEAGHGGAAAVAGGK